MMRNYRILYIVCVVVLLCCLVAPVAPAAADAAPEEASSPYIIFPRDEDVFTTTPKFRFTDFSAQGATKYRIDIWEGDDYNAPPIYTFKFAPNCNAGECWYKPDIKLKNYDFNGENGEYSWRIRAKVGTQWPVLWSQASFRVLSSGFTSTFDLNYKKWLPQAGSWSVTSAGYLKTPGLFDTTATILRQELFANTTNGTDGIVYEVTMKRKAEADSTNRLFFHGNPGDTYVSGPWEDGYMFEYTNDGHWSLVRMIDFNKTYLVEDSPSTAINPYGWNKLSVWRKNTEIHLWINGSYLGHYADNYWWQGFVGIGVFEGDIDKSPLLVDKARVWYTDTAPYTTIP